MATENPTNSELQGTPIEETNEAAYSRLEEEAKMFDSRLQKAFDFCADATKQMITVAVGIIAFTITFSKDFIGTVDDNSKYWAFAAWMLFFLSVIFGGFTLSGLTGQLDPGSDYIKGRNNVPIPSIWASGVRVPMIAQWICFFFALLLSLVHGCISMTSTHTKPKSEVQISLPNSTVVIRPTQPDKPESGTQIPSSQSTPKVLSPRKDASR